MLLTWFYHLSCLGRDINYLMICLLALPPRERRLKGAVWWCWSHIFLPGNISYLKLLLLWTQEQQPLSLESQFSWKPNLCSRATKLCTTTRHRHIMQVSVDWLNIIVVGLKTFLTQINATDTYISHLFSIFLCCVGWFSLSIVKDVRFQVLCE